METTNDNLGLEGKAVVDTKTSLSLGSSTPPHITRDYEILDQKLAIDNDNGNGNGNGNSKTANSIDELLSSAVFDEIQYRVRKGDRYSIDLVLRIRAKLKSDLSNYKDIVRFTLIALKPICLIFLFELYLGDPMQI